MSLRPHQMDQADRQRVALGRALVRHANAYVFDEPFTAQDPRLRGHIRSAVVNRQRRLERTTIITTRDPVEAMALGAPVMVLHQGIVHQIGTVRDVHNEPANVFVAALFGAEPMNLLAGRIRGDTVELPVGTTAVPSGMAVDRKDGDTIIVGVRPSDLQCASPGADTGLRFSGTVGEVQWHGDSQRVFIGFDLDGQTEELFAEIEAAVQFTMFQPYIAARMTETAEVALDEQIAFHAPAD